MGVDTTMQAGSAGTIDFVAVENSPEFKELRSRQRNFVFPVLGGCLLWYLAYVLLATWATDFMSIRVFGYVNWGMILGLGQVATTFAVTMWYVGFANRKLDPAANSIREALETKAGDQS